MDPSPPKVSPNTLAQEKAALRRRFRAVRRDFVAALPPRMSGLLFLRPPGAVAERLAPGTTVGLYHPHPHEAPTLGYARWLHENGHAIALPHFKDRAAPMTFRVWSNPLGDGELEPGPFGVLQPGSEAASVIPQVLIVPLLAFTAAGMRLGQGGGHYDRWLAAHPDTLAIGMAWDSQLADDLPHETHDRPLAMIVTPTRLYEGQP